LSFVINPIFIQPIKVDFVEEQKPGQSHVEEPEHNVVKRNNITIEENNTTST